MKATGFIKLSRTLLNWRWYTNANTMRVYLHLLLKANFCDVEFETHIVKRGQLVTSIKSLCEELSMTTQATRTALEHLVLTNDITIKTTTKYSIITILNYEKYASTTNVTSNEQQANNKRPTNKQQQYNKYNNKKKYNKSKSSLYRMTDEELEIFNSKSLYKD